MKKRAPLMLVVVLLLLGAAAWGFDLPTRLGWRSGDTSTLTLYGNVDIRQVELGFRVAGRIASMHVDEGDSVHAGDLLATLDARPYQDAVATNEAQVGQQSANLDKLVAGPRPAEIDEARANLAERTADVANAERAFARAEKLRPTGVISQSALDDAQAAKDMAAAREAAAKEALRLLEEGTRAEDIAAGRASLAAAQASLASAQTSLADTRLVAPADGIVLSRVREPGAIVSPSDVVYVLSLTRPVWIRAYVAEPNLSRIHPGMAVEVAIDGARRTYHGQIGFISPVAEFTPKSVETPELRTDLVYRLRVVVDDADEALRQGMPVTLHIPLQVATAKADE